nr:hypothetical protein [Tanacetum cinerariifolium]
MELEGFVAILVCSDSFDFNDCAYMCNELPTVSHSEVGYKGYVPMMLMDENLSENTICYGHYKRDTKDLESSRKRKLRSDLGQNDVNKDDTDVIRNPRKVSGSKKCIESYRKISNILLKQVNQYLFEELIPKARNEHQHHV